MPPIPRGSRGGVITGWGACLPDKVVTNDDLVRDDGHERRLDPSSAPASRNATSAAPRCRCRSSPVAAPWTSRASTRRPSTCSSWPRPRPTKPCRARPPVFSTTLGLRCGAFDVNAACSGFTYALVVAHGLIAAGANRALVIGTDTLSRITDWTDRGTAILFADGSGAVVLEAVDGPGELLGWDIDADGSLVAPALRRHRRLHPHGWQGGLPAGRAHHGRLGREVDEARRRHGRRHRARRAAPGQHPHHRSGLQPPRRPDGDAPPPRIDRTGNTSSASIPLALADALDDGRVHDGDLVLLVGFGAGMTAASAVLRWGGVHA